MIGLILGGIILLVFIIGFVFIKTSPQFGGKAAKEQVNVFEQSGHYENGLFQNEIPTSMDMGFKKFMSILRDYIRGVPDQAPKRPLAVAKVDSLDITSRPDSITRLTWFGHSAFLLEMDGKNILIDPMFGPVAPAPHPLLGRKRFTEGLPIAIEQLPRIDVVLLSHDHYDHLDYGSIMQLKGKVGEFYSPLGVGIHLQEWGVDPEKIHELNWWEEAVYNELKFVCTPARHFSGRGFGDRFKTFWSSWVIEGRTHKLYFSGDSGYGPHFKTIGEKYGPFDLAMMECGQYDERWSEIHMMPEETAIASAELQAKLMMPIHWGSFVLALHSWYDPVVRVTKKAEELGLPVTVPEIGEPIRVGEEVPLVKWWEDLK